MTYLSILLLATGFFYVQEPVVSMREQPSYHSKIVSQAIFSEPLWIEKEVEGWSLATLSDHYSGWIPSSSFTRLEAPYKPTLKVSRLKAHIYDRADIEYGPLFTLPYGAQLQALVQIDERWVKVVLPYGQEAFIQLGDVSPEPVLSHKGELSEFSRQFLGLPYTWGGRSSLGYDCSGFVQMLYHQMGVLLPRDSKDQACNDRFSSIPLEALAPGDLIFFGKSAEQIMHVGLYIGHNQFIHATARENTPWIKISNLTDLEWSGHGGAYYPYRLGRRYKS